MITPYRIAQVQIARVCCRADNSTADRADGCACGRTSCRCTNQCASARANQGAGGGTVAGICAAADQTEYRYHRRASDETFHTHYTLLARTLYGNEPGALPFRKELFARARSG
jgi:hypothetical protein